MELGDQGGWLLALALVGLVSLAIAERRSRDRVRGAALLVLGGWFLAGGLVYSFSSGIVHTYYVSGLAPAIAGLAGAGVVSLWRDARRGGWWVLLPISGFAVDGLIELVLLRRSGYDAWLQAIVLLGALGAALVLSFGVRRAATSAAAVATAALLAAPLAWSATTWQTAVNGVFPGAGPSFVSSFGGGGVARGSSDLSSVLAWVKAHGATSRYTLIVSNEEEAAPSIVHGERVASMGGFTGRETVMSNAFLASLVASGEARYFYLDGSGVGLRYGNAGISTIERACTEVSTSLYDCAGKASAIAAASS